LELPWKLSRKRELKNQKYEMPLGKLLSGMLPSLPLNYPSFNLEVEKIIRPLV